MRFSEIGACQSLWYNKNIRSKSKQYFYFENWYAKNVCSISDLLNPPLPGSRLFEELVLDFDVSRKDRKKYNSLIKCIPHEWLDHPTARELEVVPTIIDKLVNTRKVPRYVYNTMIEKCFPERRYDYWNNIVDVQQDVSWEKIHLRNFYCTIDTRLRSFYFKVFHKTIALNTFLHKIKRKDSPNCSFCEKMPETMAHLFCDCEIVTPLWRKLADVIQRKHDPQFVLTNFCKLFGVIDDKYLSFLMLVLKYFVFVCKFKDTKPHFKAFSTYLTTLKETEYYLAKKKGKLSAHFRKWRFDL